MNNLADDLLVPKSSDLDIGSLVEEAGLALASLIRVAALSTTLGMGSLTSAIRVTPMKSA